jgi:HSP20 family molecular chaperone IbpA
MSLPRRATSTTHYYRRERRTGSVSRRISLPRNTPDVEVAAELADGVRTLTVPTPEKQKPKQIEIKSSS